jgi:hypothetical protein
MDPCFISDSPDSRESDSSYNDEDRFYDENWLI